MAAGYQREPLVRCRETNFARGACVCICSRGVWRRGRRLPVISVVVVAVCRLQRRRVSAHAVADGLFVGSEVVALCDTPLSTCCSVL